MKNVFLSLYRNIFLSQYCVQNIVCELGLKEMKKLDALRFELTNLIELSLHPNFHISGDGFLCQ